MKIDASLLNDSPMWNREVAGFLHDVPVYSRQDNLNAHRKLHVQPGFEIDICHHGRAIVVIGDRTFVQSPDCLFIIPGHVPHQIYPDLSVPYRRTVICFDDRTLRSRLQLGESNVFDFAWAADPGMHRLQPDTALFVQIKSLSGQMCEEIGRRANGWETMALSHLLGISVLLNRWVENRDRIRPPERELSHYVDRCCDYIATHLHEDLALPTVAKLFSVSPEQLIRSFKRDKGMTFYQYVLLQRVMASKKWLLSSPELPVTEIALMLGFSSSSQFSRTFRTIAGCTPTEYRAAGKSKNPNPARSSELAALPDNHGNSDDKALPLLHLRMP
ncbi:MAG: AraC family transcriptional regulator [Paenibacillus sp.]|jgi:AraC-like DNA-binding protein|nr:AraC family transcriptional regulator [Paenibacillus sp.]